MPTTSRRDFLKSSALVAAGGSLTISSLLADEAKPKLTHANKGKIFKANKGGTIGRSEAAMVEVMEEYRKLGFDGIEGMAPGINVKDAQAAVKETNFPIHGVVGAIHWKARLSDPDPAVREKGLKSFMQGIRDCKAIGGTSILLVPGKVTGPDETHDDVWKRSIVEIRKALPLAKEQNIKILVENVWNGFCEKPELFRDYIDEIDDPMCGVYFDIGNVRKFGKPEEWIVILNKRIGKLDVKDWGAKNGFCRLGEGDVDWPAVRAALKQIEFTGWATREGKDKSLADTSELMSELLDI